MTFLTKRTENAKVAMTPSIRLPIEYADQINKKIVKLFRKGIDAPKLPNKRYQNLQPFALAERNQIAVASKTTFSMVVCTTWISKPHNNLTSPTMSRFWTTLLLYNLASEIYSTFISNHSKSHLNLKLNFYWNLFCKLFNSKLILFCKIALSV